MTNYIHIAFYTGNYRLKLHLRKSLLLEKNKKNTVMPLIAFSDSMLFFDRKLRNGAENTKMC